MELKNLIGGERTAAAATLQEIDPASGAPIHTIQDSGAPEIDDAVGAARAAFGSWSATPAPSRGDVLFRAASIIDRDAAALTDAMVAEVGKPRREAAGEVARTAAILRYFAGEGRRAPGAVLPSDTTDVTLSLRAPLGVAGLITPWNFPLAIPAWKLAPALIAGNAVVLKPAEQSGRMAIALADAVAEAGLPAGVLNVVLGAAAAGAALVDHAGIDAVSFTGSTAVGSLVRKAAAARGVRAQLEMGGKNVAVVLADADLKRAATAVAMGAFAFAGQKCTATGLCAVERSVFDQFSKLLDEALLQIAVGDPADDRTLCGPLIEESAAARAESLGAERFGDRGWFVRPAIVRDRAPDDAICRDELFAPILPLVDVADFDEALSLAASLPTGLSAGLHTAAAANAWRFAREVRAGVLAINRPTTGLEVQAPFGGLKASGSEHKEQGAHATDFYTETKTVYWTP